MLISILISGGALITSAKLYEKNKRKKETPWTVYAEKVGVIKHKKNNWLATSLSFSRRLAQRTAIDKIQATIQTFKQDTTRPLWGDTRQPWLKKGSPTAGQIQVSQTEKELNRHLAVAVASLGLAAGGALIYPPLSLFSVPGVIYSSHPIFKNGYKSLIEEREVNIDVLNAIIVTMLIGTGHYVLLNFPIVLSALRRKLVAKVKDDSSGAIIDVFRLQARTVWVDCDGVEIEVHSEALKRDDVVIVRAGETIPVDGTVLDGMATVDQHILTGESQPVHKEVGDPVFALTIVLSGRIYIQIEKTGEETTAAQIGQILNETVDFKTNMQLHAEVFVDKLMLPTLLVSGLAWPVIGISSAAGILNSPPRDNMTIAAAICILNYLQIASRQGILIKDGRTLELLNQVDTIVFDKTGTLTQEQPHVGEIHAYNGYTVNEILRYTAAAERNQAHPIARSILSEAKARELDLPTIKEAEYKIGYGLTVSIDNKQVHIGSSRFIEMMKITIPTQIRQIQEACHALGYSLVMVAIDEQVVGAIELHPTVRPEAQEIIRQLRQRHIKYIYIISGDHEAPTKKLAEELGIDHYFAQTLPEQKAELIEQLQKEGKSVCFIGDGINDSIALKKAQVSISLRGASTVATDTAQVVLMDESLRQLCNLFDLAQEFKHRMKFTYVAICIPHLLAASGALFLHFGFVYAVLMNQVGFFSGLTNVMFPLVKHRGGASEQISQVTQTSLPVENIK
jgi:Cu2+-exporting ATPase